MMRAPRRLASSTIWATSRRGMRSVTITISLMPFSIASKTASLVKAGGTVTTDPSIGAAVVGDGLRDGVEHRHPVDLAPQPTGGDAADDLRAGAVVQALAGQVDGLAAGDPLDDEGRVGVDQDAHAATPWIFSTARRAASLQRHAAVGVLDAVALEDLEALLLPGARDAEDRDLLRRIQAELQAGLDHAARDDVHARVRDDRHHHRDLVDAGLAAAPASPARRPLRPTGCRRSRSSWRACRRAARTASNSVSEPPPAPITSPRLPSNSVTLPRRRDGRWRRPARRPARRGSPRAPGASPRRRRRAPQQLPVARARLVLDLHVGVERYERAVRQRAERVDLGERHVVLDEQPRQARRAIGTSLLQRRAGDARGGDHLLGLEVRTGQDVREVPRPTLSGCSSATCSMSMPADGREDDHRALARAVPDDARVVLLLDLGLRVDEHAARHVPADLQLEDLARVGLGLLRASRRTSRRRPSCARPRAPGT